MAQTNAVRVQVGFGHITGMPPAVGIDGLGGLVRLDADGCCGMTGHVRDMIMRDGENVSPRDIEGSPYTHPGIGQVQVFGETVATWIVPKPGTELTEEEIRDFCRDVSPISRFPRL